MISLGVKPQVDLPQYWSPSRLGLMRSCQLRLAASLDPALKRQLDRGNTFSAMGNVAHKLTEAAWSNRFQGVDEAGLKAALAAEWANLANEQFLQLVEDWGTNQVPQPRDWPYYAVTKVKTIARLMEEIKNRSVRAKESAVGVARVEKMIVDEVRRIHGIPDRVILTGDGFYVLDLKTGHAITEITEAYRRQLIIYAHLVSQTTAEPLLGLGVVTAGGDTIWADVTQADIDQVIDESVRAIEVFEQDALANSPESLATPSPSNCRFCAYKNVCSSYWMDTDPEWFEHRGVLGKVINVIDGKACTLEQHLPEDGRGEIVGVSNTTHNLEVGDWVSVTDGFLRDRGFRGSWYSKVVKLQPIA